MDFGFDINKQFTFFLGVENLYNNNYEYKYNLLHIAARKSWKGGCRDKIIMSLLKAGIDPKVNNCSSKAIS